MSVEIPSYSVGSKEYVKAKVVADVLLSTQPVEMKVNGTWRSASWLGSADTERVCETLVDFAGAAVGYQTVYVRITDSPEVPIIDAGKIVIRP